MPLAIRANPAVAEKKRMHLLYLTAEPWPTFRVDVVSLFGKYLPRHGITCDLATESGMSTAGPEIPLWGGGNAFVCKVPRSRSGQYLVKFWHLLITLIAFDKATYVAIQVRDMPVIALFGLITARISGVPFFYWISFPHSEAQIDRAMRRGPGAGMRFLFPLIQGLAGRFLLYRIILPRADHVFVQSVQMQNDLAAAGIPLKKMTPVPMGVDMESAEFENVQPSSDVRLQGKRVLIYLGTLDPLRNIEVLFDALAQIRAEIPDVLLVLAGDTEDIEHRQWLRNEASRLGVSDQVLWTGWLPLLQAWRYVRSAEIGLSPFPRSFLLDSASPTKIVEYMALQLPVVANDNPDQAQILLESGAGMCVPLTSTAFAESVIGLLRDPGRLSEMGRSGRNYVIQYRSYAHLARMLKQRYIELVSTDGVLEN